MESCGISGGLHHSSETLASQEACMSRPIPRLQGRPEADGRDASLLRPPRNKVPEWLVNHLYTFLLYHI